jgi:hypothetical protein
MQLAVGTTFRFVYVKFHNIGRTHVRVLEHTSVAPREYTCTLQRASIVHRLQRMYVPADWLWVQQARLAVPSSNLRYAASMGQHVSRQKARTT